MIETYGNPHHHDEPVVLNKASSNSAHERGLWNLVGWNAFIESWGPGVGLGSTRTSSMAFALLSNVGILGTLFYLLFAGGIFGYGRQKGPDLTADIRLAARNACIGLFLGELLVATPLDQDCSSSCLRALQPANQRSPHSHVNMRLF